MRQRLNPALESRSMLDMQTLLTLLFLLGSAHAGEFDSLTAYPVSRVIDGDTVELLIDGSLVKVRLIGVDTPETVHPSKPVERYGKEASAFTRNLLRRRVGLSEVRAGESGSVRAGVVIPLSSSRLHPQDQQEVPPR